MLAPRTDTDKLRTLRFMVARLAQVTGVETGTLPVLNATDEAIRGWIETEDAAWNQLVAVIAGRIDCWTFLYPSLKEIE